MAYRPHTSPISSFLKMTFPLLRELRVMSTRKQERNDSHMRMERDSSRKVEETENQAFN